MRIQIQGELMAKQLDIVSHWHGESLIKCKVSVHKILGMVLGTTSVLSFYTGIALDLLKS